MIEVLIGLLAYVISWLLIPSLRKLAIRWQFVDRPNKRKVHKDPLPMLGGVAIFIGFLVATLSTLSSWKGESKTYIGLIIGATLLFLIGLVDDYYKTRGKDFPSLPRLIVQIIAAALVSGYGGTVQGFTMPYPHAHYVQFPHGLAIALTIIWIVGVINVFNFIDGLDGLSAGIAAISAVTLVFVAVLKKDIPSALWAVALAGSCLGFLKHNFYPARIIMGDSGSTVIGFLLGSISVIGAFKSVTVVSIFVPVLALGVPIFDGIRVVTRRLLNGQHPHKPDRSHGHHKLLDAGFTQVQTVAVLYLVSACLSLTSIILLLSSR